MKCRPEDINRNRYINKTEKIQLKNIRDKKKRRSKDEI